MAFLVFHACKDNLREEISLYFKDLFNFTMSWQKVVAKNVNKAQAMTFSNLLTIFDTALTNMPFDNKLPEMMTILQDLKCDHSSIENLKLPPITSELIITSPLLASPKHLSEDVRSMDNCYNIFPLLYLLPCICHMPPLLLFCSSI